MNTTQESVQKIGEIVERLDNRIRLICSRFANGDAMKADDIYGYVIEKVLEYGKPDASDTQILTLVKWQAQNFLQKERTYTMYVGSECEVSPTNSEDDEDQGDVFELYVADTQSAEDAVIEAEQLEAIRKAIETLPQKHQTIVMMLAGGQTKAEISRAMNVSKASITQTVSKIAVALGDLEALVS